MKAIIIGIVCLWLPFLNFGQKCDSVRLSGYYFSISYSNDSGPPIILSGFSHDFFYSFNDSLNNIDDVVDKLYQKGVFVSDPIISFMEAKDCFNNPSQLSDAYYRIFDKVINDFEKWNLRFEMVCNDAHLVDFYVIKLKGVFWILANSLGEFNTAFQKPLPNSIFSHDYHYCFKKIVQLEDFTTDELSKLIDNQSVYICPK